MSKKIIGNVNLDGLVHLEKKQVIFEKFFIARESITEKVFFIGLRNSFYPFLVRSDIFVYVILV